LLKENDSSDEYYSINGGYPPLPPGQYQGDTPPPPMPPAHRSSDEERLVSRLGLAGWSALLLIPFVVLLMLFLMLVLIGRPYVVHGSSMIPTLHDGDRVFVVPYRGNTTPNRGDVVVLKDVGGTSELLIKRVVALAGDKITVGKGRILVNDKYAHKSTHSNLPEGYSQLVPLDTLFVMGDNESHSFDSRTFGPVQSSKVVGKAMVIFWPPGDLKKL
jgi:signal peptidase I